MQFSDRLVKDAEGLDPLTRQKAEFYLRQIVNAIAPSNFVLTNPELLRDTLASKGENLARGMHMLAEDIQAGGGELRIRQTDTSHFEVGRNLASTPGKVIFENDLMQLIQYAPATETVLKVPMLIVPPWINKFYVLDLTPEKSFIKWCVDQGLTVFVISWVNPGRRICRRRSLRRLHARRPARRARRRQAGDRREQGACGRLLRRRHAARRHARPHGGAAKDQRIVSSTFFASQVDFTYSGDLKIFADEDQITALEKQMAERGYLDSRKMANTFNLMRSNDLIWPYIINNYFKGKTPPPFDLLYWNADATRMPRGQPLVLPAQLLSQEQARARRDGDRRQDARPQEGEGADLQSRHPRGPHRAGEVGVLRLEIFRRRRCGSCSPAPATSRAWSIRPTSRSTSIGPAPKPSGADVDKWRAKATEHRGLLVAGLVRLAQGP